MAENGRQGRKVPIEVAKLYSAAGAFVHWRPESELPEADQYALVYEE